MNVVVERWRTWWGRACEEIWDSLCFVSISPGCQILLRDSARSKVKVKVWVRFKAQLRICQGLVPREIFPECISCGGDWFRCREKDNVGKHIPRSECLDGVIALVLSMKIMFVSTVGKCAGQEVERRVIFISTAVRPCKLQTYLNAHCNCTSMEIKTLRQCRVLLYVNGKL